MHWRKQPTIHLGAGGRVGDEPDLEADVLEEALDVVIVLDVKRLYVGQHRHLATARALEGIDLFSSAREQTLRNLRTVSVRQSL